MKCSFRSKTRESGTLLGSLFEDYGKEIVKTMIFLHLIEYCE